MPPTPITETTRDFPSRPVACSMSFSCRSSSARPTNGGSIAVPVVALALGDHAEGAPCGDRPPLALQREVAHRVEGHGARGGAERRLAHEHLTRLGGGLQPGRGVHHVARDHALVLGVGRGGRLPRQHAAASLQRKVHRGTERGDRVHELEAGTDRSLGVVLVGDRGPPHRHDRVPDELFDHAAVAFDHGPRSVEVRVHQRTHVLGVALLGERGERHEVEEQDRDQAALGRAWRRFGGRKRVGRTAPARERRTALAAELARWVRAAA